METLRRLTDQIGTQLKLLNPSQRIAIGLCAVIVAGSLGWLLTWSASPELVPLLPQDLSYDELDRAEEALMTRGIDYETRGQRVFVSASDQPDAIRVLNKADALPRDTSVGFTELLKDDSPFRPEGQNRMRYEIALGNELARIIASAPDVSSARVLVQSEAKRRLTGPATVPTASVWVTMDRGHQITQANVEAFARLVAGPVPGLEPHRVKVIDAVTLRPYDPVDPENAWAANMLDRKKAEEQHLLKKILNHLSYIPGVLAAVTVELDGSKRQTETVEWAEPTPKSGQTRSFKGTSAQTPGETGANPNTGIALTGTGTAAGSEEKESREEFFDAKPKSTTVADIFPGATLRITAAISIPRSFFVSVFKAQPGNKDTEPADGEPVFEAIKKREQERIRSNVMSIVQTQAAEDVIVEPYYDFDPATGVPREGVGALAQAGLAEGGDYVMTVRQYVPEAGLLLLALFALFMLILMVRKSTRAAAAIPSPRYATEERHPDLVTGADGILRIPGGPVGEADMPEGMLQGQEVDEDSLKFKQLGEQVSRMVDESPQIAADLLKRWVEAEQ